MGYILLGVLGFIGGYGFELVSAKGTARLKPVLAIAVAGLLIYSTVMVSFPFQPPTGLIPIVRSL